jgi:LAO/AO transport system kinase
MGLPDHKLARLISGLEHGSDDAVTALDRLWAGAPSGLVVGLSGPPGVGKSVMTGQLVHAAIRAGHRTAVLAVDPSSPFTGGAVLADRMRLQSLGVPKGVFVRSLASRGALGGLSAVVPAAIRALEAAAYTLVLVETVGVGQNETDIVSVADTVVVVQAPGAGDEVQGLKSGLPEIADIFVLNKCELAGAEQARAVLQDIARHPRRGGWVPPVVSTIALDGSGIPDLWQAIEAHHSWLASTNFLRERRDARLMAELFSAARAVLMDRFACLALIERFREGKITVSGALDEALAGYDKPAPFTNRGQRRM